MHGTPHMAPLVDEAHGKDQVDHLEGVMVEDPLLVALKVKETRVIEALLLKVEEHQALQVRVEEHQAMEALLVKVEEHQAMEALLVEV